jgi:hypothetical protein
MIKLLALDLDGTLLDSGGMLSDGNRDAIRRAEEAGVLVTIATGRRFRDARPVALDIGLNAPIITHNGALLKFADTLEALSADTLAAATCLHVIEIGREFGGDALVSVDPEGKGTLLYDRISEDNIPLRKYIAWSRLLHGDEAEDAIHHVDDLGDAVYDHSVIHISFSGGCAPMYELQRVLEDELEESVNILATIYPHLDFTLLDVLPPRASKATGLHALATLHGLSHEQVMVCGDNFNDLEMLDYAGTSVVMGNAAPELRAREEFFVTASNDEDGVARAIEKFILP